MYIPSRGLDEVALRTVPQAGYLCVTYRYSACVVVEGYVNTL